MSGRAGKPAGEPSRDPAGGPSGEPLGKLSGEPVAVTGSSGHLGEALVRVLTGAGAIVRGLDRRRGPYTSHVGDIADRHFLADALEGVRTLYHSATLHKPHVATHSAQDFIDSNLSGTLALLEVSLAAGVSQLVFTSTTSTFGAALRPAAGEPAAWITEDVSCVPKNIYGVTKVAAEDLCELYARRHGLPCVVLRTSRFFAEADDDAQQRAAFSDRNLKANEFLYRRVDLEDVVHAHLLAAQRAAQLKFRRYIISATSPLDRAHCQALNQDAGAVLRAVVPQIEARYARLGFALPARIDRVYVNARARAELGWEPRYDFARILEQLAASEPLGSALAQSVGGKGYHDEIFSEGPYPVADE